MTGDQMLELFKFLGIIAGGTVSIWKFFEWMGKRSEEKSVGITAIKQLVAADVKIQLDIDKLESNDASQTKQIQELKSDQKEFANNVFRLLTK